MPDLFLQSHLLQRPGGDAVAVQVVFAPSRSVVRNVRIQGLPAGIDPLTKWSTSYGGPTLVEATWKEPFDVPLTVEVTLEEVPLVVLGVTWCRRPQRLRRLLSLLRGTRQADEVLWAGLIARVWSESLRQLLIRTARGRMRRAHEAARLSGLMQQYGMLDNVPPIEGTPPDKGKSFFTLLDEATLTGRSNQAQPGMISAADTMRTQLWDRLMKRVDGQPEPPMDTGLINLLSGLQLRLYRGVFGDLSQPGACNDVAFAFRKFASGQFSDNHDGFGEPDSAYFFLFAEFALAALKVVSAHDQATWASLLPALVSSQAVYIKAYQPPPGQSRRWENWRWDNCSPKTPLTIQQAENAGSTMMAALHPTSNFETVTAANARDAFRDRAQQQVVVVPAPPGTLI